MTGGNCDKHSGAKNFLCRPPGQFLTGLPFLFILKQEKEIAMKTDIEIAQATAMKPIMEIAETAGIETKYLEQYGNYKAKVDLSLLKETEKKDGKLILVTAITPTPAGEGKTTTTIGLADGLKKIGKNVMIALREPSLGPVFGVKGGAAGGGYAQVVPWKISISISRATSMQSVPQTTFLPRCLITTSIRATALTSIPDASRGSVALT